MTLTKDDKKEMTDMIVDAINGVIVPALDNLKEDLANKDDVKEIGLKLDSLGRKFNAQEDRLDRHDQRIESLEKIHI